jgi:hypothetical protein
MRTAALSACLIFSLWLTGCSCLPCLDRPYIPSGHADSWDPVLGSCGTCGVCGGTCDGHTPASYIKHRLTCGSGCGEIYWGEWLSDPPEKCDPCDDCGNWIGPRICDPSVWERFASGWCGFFGFRSDGCSSCSAAPCAICGTGCDGSCGGKGGLSPMDLGPLLVPPPMDDSPLKNFPADVQADREPILERPPPTDNPTAGHRSVLRSTRF